MDKIFTFINGEYVPFNQSFLHVSDLTVQRGYAVFDFFLVKEGVPRFMPFHLDRFYRSAALLEMTVPYTKEELSAIVRSLIVRNGHPNSSVKIILTGGLSPDDFTLVPSNSTLIVINKPFELAIPEGWRNGARLITSNYQREMPEAKTINYIRSVNLSQRLMASNAAEVLYLDRKWVRECSRSNIFYVKDQCVYTPGTKILQGITRKRILSAEGIQVREKDCKLEELLGSEEVFITSTTKGVLPIVQIDGTIIADGQVGPVTKVIQKLIMNNPDDH